jgi:hypothetical protein
MDAKELLEKLHGASPKQNSSEEQSKISPMKPFKIPHRNATVWFVDKRYPDWKKFIES